MEQNSEDKHNKPDPGWNDPPLFTYERATAIQASVNKKRTSLNKRVAYPMHNKVTTSLTTLDTAAPPLISNQTKMNSPQCTASCVPSADDFSKNKYEIGNLNKSEKLDEVLNNLEMLLTENDEEVNKRIKILEKMWADGKLDESVKSKLLELTEALCKGDIELADRLQIGLMVDHVAQCSSWMSGIRQLINKKKNSKEPKEP